MKRELLTLTLIVLLTITAQAQLKLIDHGVYEFVGGEVILVEPAGTEDLNGTTVDVEAPNMNADNEHAIWVVNEGDESLTIRVVRTEIDVPVGTENNVCWGLCPVNNQAAGEQPVWIVGGTSTAFTETLAPGDTAISFAFHHFPVGVDGCSLYRLDFFDNATVTEVYASFDLRFDHSVTGNCAVGLNDLRDRIQVSLVPNPSSEITNLILEGVDSPVGVQVMDVLGQVVFEDIYTPYADNRMRLNTSSMRNGIYFVSILDQDEILRTIKLVVKH